MRAAFHIFCNCLRTRMALTQVFRSQNERVALWIASKLEKMIWLSRSDFRKKRPEKTKLGNNPHLKWM